MLLARKFLTLGSTEQFTVDYSERRCSDPYTIASFYPIRDGDSITSATVVSSATDVTVGTVTVYEGHKVVFKLSGGVVNEVFTLTVSVTTDNGETFIDTVSFTVVAP